MKARKTKHPGAGRTNLSLQLPPEEAKTIRQGLRKIMGWMLSDPEMTESKIGHQSAVKYAIAHTLKNPPKHVGAK